MSQVKDYFHDCHFHKNKLIKFAVESGGSLPGDGVIGQLFYLLALNTGSLYHYNGSAWLQSGGVYSVLGTGAIEATPAAGTGNVVISIVPATHSVPGSMSAADKYKLDHMTTIDDDTDVVHDPSGQHKIGSGSTNVYLALADLDDAINLHETASNPHNMIPMSYLNTDIDLGGASGGSDMKVSTQKAVKTYVDAMLSASGHPAEPYATGGNSVSYPPTYNGGGITKGDQFIISDDGGSVGPATAIAVNSNDTLIANKTTPGNVHANWTVITSTPVQHADKGAVATTGGTIYGTVKYAGEDAIDYIVANQDPSSNPGEQELVVSPYLMQYYLSILKPSFMLKVTKTIAAGGTTVPHSFGTKDVTVTVYDSSRKEIGCVINAGSTANVFIGVNQTVSSARILIIAER